MVLTNAKVLSGMEVGEEYTYVRFYGNTALEVRTRLLSIQSDGTGTVEVLSTNEVPVVSCAPNIH